MKKIWILVANQAEAQIYAAEKLAGSLMLVDTLANNDGSAHARDLVADGPGSVHDRMGASRHSMEPHTGVKEGERQRFVKEMVGRLKVAYSRGDFDRLVLLAAPAVLGVLRKTLSKALENTVVLEISKDVVGQEVGKIHQQLVRAFEVA